MSAKALEVLPAPPGDASSSALCDWLELGSLLAFPKPFPVLDLVQTLDLDVDTDDDPDSLDRERETLFQSIAQEIKYREDSLDGAYPFSATADGVGVARAATLTDGQIGYIFSLLLSHCAKGGLLPSKLRPAATRLRAARDLFQVCSTIAAAGHTQGPSFSVGHPRVTKSTFHGKLREIWPHFGDGEIVSKVHPDIPTAAKDEGIDVISFWKEKDKGPSQGFLVGQVASGANWKDKSAKSACETLVTYWFVEQPKTKPIPVTFVPFDVPPREMRRETVTHGYLLCRLRLPAKLAEAVALVSRGLKPVERLQELDDVRNWVNQHLKKMQRAIA